MPDLELHNLGALVASGQGAARYKFLLVGEKAGLSAAALEKDHAFAGPELVASGEAPDKAGSASLDLAPLRADMEKKIGALGANPKIASFVVGFPASGGATAVAGPVFGVKGEPVIEVVLDIDPDDPASGDDKITLSADDGSWKETKTVKDDMVKGDRKTTLRFKIKDATKKHSIQVDPGAEGAPYWFARSFSPGTGKG